MDKQDLLLIFAFFGLLALTSYSGYYIGLKQGHKKERAALTMALVAQIEDTYYSGRSDAEADCRAGLIK